MAKNVKSEIINVRSKESTKNTLLKLCDELDLGQAEVVEKALDLLDDLLLSKKQLESDGSINDTKTLNVFARLILNSIK